MSTQNFFLKHFRIFKTYFAILWSNMISCPLVDFFFTLFYFHAVSFSTVVEEQLLVRPVSSVSKSEPEKNSGSLMGVVSMPSTATFCMSEGSGSGFFYILSSLLKRRFVSLELRLTLFDRFLEAAEKILCVVIVLLSFG